VLGAAAQGGWDKLTLLLDVQLRAFGPWAEQLVAESSGKGGTGIVPILDDEGAPVPSFGADRAFVALRENRLLGALDGRGHPVARLGRQEPVLLGAELFRWQFAVAVACHVLGVNPFDQPQVEEAKLATSQLLARGVHEQPPDGIDDGDPTAVLEGLEPGHHLGLLAYVDPRPDNEHRLRKVREALRDRFRVATTLGFGPRYLHSTGQLHKGGPPTGAFLEVVDDDRHTDLIIPGRRYTFGELIDAQALGDLVALRHHGRPVARVPLSRLEAVMGVKGLAGVT
jgi:hypothetical protein